jgi:predicted amidohydrolase
MRIAACQLPHVQNDPERALALVEQHATSAQHDGAELICFPECFLQGYDVSPSHVEAVALELESLAFEQILRRLRRLLPVVVLGLIEKRDGKFYNTAVVITQGVLVGRYRKAHLVGGEQAIFGRGDDCPVFDVDDVKVGINICYDLQFAESTDAAVAAGARLLACPCNNMLRPATAEDWKLRHNEIRCRRARDARVWMMSSDVTGEYGGRISYGPSAVIDPMGNIVAQVPLMTTGIVVVDIPGDRIA